jgi:hypothetical protein
MSKGETRSAGVNFSCRFEVAALKRSEQRLQRQPGGRPSAAWAIHLPGSCFSDR